MDRNRYYDLYVAESQDHLRALSSAILELERGGGGAALEQAFRAAHTLKGMAAAMGFGAVSTAAHELEDALDRIRRGERPATPNAVDELLGLADRVEDAVAGTPAAEPGSDAGADAADVSIPAEDGPEPASAPAGGEGGPETPASEEVAGATLPEGTALVASFRLRPTTTMKAARAFILLRRLEGLADVLGTDPVTITDDFAGELRVFLAGGADAEVIDGALRDESEVLYCEVSPPGAGPERGDGGRVPERFLHVDLRRLDTLADDVAELGVLQTRLAAVARTAGADDLSDITDQVGRRVAAVQDAALSLRMVPLREVFDRFPRVVRDTARATGKNAELRIAGADIELDRAIIDELADPLVHLLRNAVDHGIEPPDERLRIGKPATGRIWLEAEREQSRVVVRVQDDGRGVPLDAVLERAKALGLVTDEVRDVRDSELLRILSHSGVSTADAVTSISGRGVGMDVVMERIRMLGGSMAMTTEPGEGTTFTIWLPFTLAVTQALHVRVAAEDYVIPLTHVTEGVQVDAASVMPVRGRETLELRGDLLPLVRLRTLLAPPGDSRVTEGAAAVVVAVGEHRAALVVDELVGREQILLKTFDAATGTLPFFTGVTLLSDGRPALVLDPVSML